MKVLCALSGVTFNVDHVPGYLNSREAHHPIFDIPQKHLLSYARKWASHELTEKDSWLVYLALFNSTDQMIWRVPAKETPQTKSIVANNMEPLLRAIAKINTISHPSFVIPKLVITPDTQDFVNSHYWIESWHKSYSDFCEGYKDEMQRERVVKRERTLERLIKDHEKPISHYARVLAEWAADAGNFPTFLVNLGNRVIKCNEYWKEIIVACSKQDAIWKIPQEDIQELLDHCEEHLYAEGIFSNELLGFLRAGLKLKDDYLGFGDIDIPSPAQYQIISTSTNPEDVNKMAMIQSAPDSLPIESNYPSKLAYLRAKVKWDMKAKYTQELEAKQALQDHIREVFEPTAEELAAADKIPTDDDTLEIPELVEYPVEEEVEVEDEENLHE